ncbi:MAG: hypothetical protein PHW17_13960, partial [Desulfobacterales bacterium]|nr:hypothetical protein [Desulfobacterales bacterium]
MIKLRAWDHWNDEMIYSDKFDDLYDFFYDVKKRENGGNLVTLMLASNQWVHADDPIYEGDIIRFHYGAGDEIKTGIVKCQPEHFCYWQVWIPGDHFGLWWATSCCTGMQVIGNRYADREWLEDEGLVGLLDEPEKATNPWFESATLKKLADEAEKFRIFSTEKWAREYSKNHIEPNVKNALINAHATPDPKKDELCADEPGVPIPAQKPICIGSEYQDGFGHTIKEADILAFKLCGRRMAGEVKRIWSDDRYYWQVWTYESPEMKLSLRHMCEDVACSEVRVIGHISTVRQGG